MTNSSFKVRFLQYTYSKLWDDFLVKDRISSRIIRKIFYGARKKILKKEYDHYQDQYWNNLDLVQQYICKNATGNKDTVWQTDMLTRFKEQIPFKNALVIGCGNGWVERQLYDLGIATHFDAFDISESYLETAKKQRGDRDINYFKADINHLKLENNTYDVIFNVGVLHHTFRLTYAMWQLWKSLRSGGIMFNFDYIGPSHNQYSNEHLSILEKINFQLSPRFRSKHPLRPARENFDFGDPSEAIHSDLVKPTFERFFDIIYERNLNGGVAYQILWNNIDEFKKNDDEAVEALEFLIAKDIEYTEFRRVPLLFWYSIGEPKRKQDISHSDILPVE